MGNIEQIPTKFIYFPHIKLPVTNNLAVCDERGRLLIPQAIRKKFGKEFHVIKAKDEIILIPVVKDPIKVLSMIGKNSDISKYSIKQIKEEIQKQAMKEL